MGGSTFDATIVRKPRFAIAAALLCLVPVQAVIIAITTAFEFLLAQIRPTAFGRAVGAASMKIAHGLATKVMVEPRNAHMLFVYIGVSAIVLPLFTYCFITELTSTVGFSWRMALMYHCIRNGPMFAFFAYVATLTHMEAHDPRGLFKKQYWFVNRYSEFFLSMFYGHIPFNYRVGHNKIHHSAPVNGLHDVTCTQGYRRDSYWSFFDYLSKFFFYWTGVTVAAFFFKREPSTQHLAWKQVYGQIAFVSFIAFFSMFHLKFALVYLAFPFFESCNYLAGINYVWHSFAEPDMPRNDYIESVTIIKGLYNVYNSDYHVVHHSNPCMQFLDVPAAYEKDRQAYIDNKATIFENTHEFELLFWIILQRYDLMVKHFVDLTGKMTDDEKHTMILRRLAATAESPQ